MGKSLYENFQPAKEIFDQANDILGIDICGKIFNGNEEELKQTHVTQPAIFITSCAAFKAFKTEFPQLDVNLCIAAGHSLGEYSAFFAAEIFDFKTALKLVEYRAKFIQECCEKNPGTMAAVIGMEKTQLKNVCDAIAQEKGVCEMVNFNSVQQIVVAGQKSAIEMLTEKIGAVPGTRAIPLNVSGAFHSGLMAEAAEKMKAVLETAAIKDAAIPVAANVDAELTVRADEIKAKLARQINHPVLWEDSIHKMIANGVETFLEIGPGKVLTGLLRKIDKKKKALNLEDEPSLRKVVNELSALSLA